MLTETPRESLEIKPKRGALQKALRIEWLGQTLASLCWIASVFVYESNDSSGWELGDLLQLTAASAWLLANLAALGDTNT